MSPWDIIGWLVVGIIVFMLVATPIAFVVVTRYRHRALARMRTIRREIDEEARGIDEDFRRFTGR